MKKIKNIAVILLVFTCILSCNIAFATEDYTISEYSEYTDEYLEYMKLSDEEKINIREPRKYKSIKNEADISNYSMPNRKASFEPYYCLKDIIPENIVVRNQDTTGSCWAFSAISMLETNLAMQNYKAGKPAKVYDFSELHIEYSCLNFYKNGQTKSPYGYNRSLGHGGNFAYASSYFMSGQGAVEEKSLPFVDYTRLPGYNASLDADPKTSAIIDIQNVTNKKVVAQVFDTVQFDYAETEADIAELTVKMKNHLKNYGALSAPVFVNGGGVNYITGAIYENIEDLYTDHEVVIIGWDDNYAISNFKAEKRPSKPGAWIVKNSWGTEVGKEGIFYVSYEDKRVYTDIQAITNCADGINYDNIYQYDYLYPNSTISLEHPSIPRPIISIGEEFSKNTDKVELLNSVSLYVPASGFKYEVYVGNDKNHLSLVTLEDGTTSKIFTEVGYHTLKFKNSIELKNPTFFVAIKVYSINSNITYIAVEAPSTGDEWQYAKNETGKSFVITGDVNFSTANWMDYSSNGDFTIKAYTKLANGGVDVPDNPVDTPDDKPTDPPTEKPSDKPTPVQPSKPTELKNPFVDVRKTDWYYSAVSYVYTNNIITGTSKTTFAPNDKLTRAMVVTILHRMEGSPAVSGKSKFPDVQNAKQYYYPAVKWATDKGIVNGYKNGKFGPEDYITREDLAVILNKYAKFKGKNTSQINNLSGFKDTGKISNYALPQLKWAVGAGVITGNSDKTLNPKGNSTRAEAAAMFEKYCKNVGR